MKDPSYNKKMNLFLLLILSCWADVDLKNAESFLELSSSELEWKQTVRIKPLKGYHLNLKSPHKCGAGKVQNLAEHSIDCLMMSFGEQQLEVFVCDDANTFCRRELLEVRVHQPSGFKGWWDYIKTLL